jgi:hypothetical protein
MPGGIGAGSGFVNRELGKSICASSALLRLGKGGALMAGGGNLLIFSSAAGVGNGADTTEDTLFTATLPPNVLDIAGRQILLEAFGALSATNAVKTIRMYFGASIIYTAAIVTPAAVTAGDWSAQLLITKVGVGHNTQIGVGSADFSGAAVVRNVQKFTAGSEVDTAPIIVKVTGQSSVATANSASCNQFVISGYN